MSVNKWHGKQSRFVLLNIIFEYQERFIILLSWGAENSFNLKLIYPYEAVLADKGEETEHDCICMHCSCYVTQA